MRSTTIGIAIALALAGVVAIAAPTSAEPGVACPMGEDRPCLSDACTDDLEATLGPDCGIPWP